MIFFGNQGNSGAKRVERMHSFEQEVVMLVSEKPADGMCAGGFWIGSIDRLLF